MHLAVASMTDDEYADLDRDLAIRALIGDIFRTARRDQLADQRIVGDQYIVHQTDRIVTIIKVGFDKRAKQRHGRLQHARANHEIARARA